MPGRRLWVRSFGAVLMVPFALFSWIAGAAPLDLAAVAGVYKHRFPNGGVTGEKWISEDILETVRLTPRTAYVKTHLEFYNGHQCGIAGVADVEGDGLVYVDRSDDATVGNAKRCVLTLRVSSTRIDFEDPDYACKALYCGVRGGFGGGFDRTDRRTIRYMKLLRDSADFRRAIAEHARPDPRLPATR